jgi:acyl carrier protein phosphodiesterase
MNWLAHLLLADPTPIDRVASLIPDLLPMQQWRELAPPFQAGIERHRQIDIYTDKHSLFQRSRSRLQSPYRRYGAVYIDLFYDHFLTIHWQQFAKQDFNEFLAGVYAAFDECRDQLPSDANRVLQRMKLSGWLETYGDIDGLRQTLERMSHRLKRPFELAAGIVQLEANYQALQQDFHEFFPELIRHLNIEHLRR